MKTRTRSTTMIACLMGLLAVGAVAYLDKPTAIANDKERFEFGMAIEHPFGEKAVKGAPFSAQVILDNTQTLANGSHISRKMTGALYRDGEGRTRQELPRDGATEAVVINDNVADVLYHLHMFDHTARKVNVSNAHINRELGEHARFEELRKNNRENEEREQMEKAKSARSERVRRETEPERRIESLGIQTYEGVQAEVTRFTITIPAGREGNDQALEIVSERWYSPELQIVVMSKRSDPRSGEIVYRLTNINRGEQPHSLFEAPPDFTVVEEKPEFRRKEKQ